MKIEAKTEVRKELTLTFQLPGTRWHYSGSAGQRQLLQQFEEEWSITVHQSNALETAETLNKLAAAIIAAMKEQ